MSLTVDQPPQPAAAETAPAGRETTDNPVPARVAVAITDRLHAYLGQLERTLQEGGWPLPTAQPASLPAPDRSERREQQLIAHLLPHATRVLDAAYAELTSIDVQLSPAERWACRRYHRAMLHGFFLQSALVRRIYDRPLGYPGDFGVVELLFAEHDAGDSALGQLLSWYAREVGPSRAYRRRVAWALGQLDRLQLTAGRPLRVLSFGCGPEPVLREFLARGGRGTLTLCDFDPCALEQCRHHFRRLERQLGTQLDVDYMQLSRQRLIGDGMTAASLRLSVGTDGYDAILVVGLLDYLETGLASTWLDLLMGMLRPGGELLLTTMHRANPWRAFMEYVGNLHLLHRDEEALRDLVVGRPPRLQPVELVTDAANTNLYVAGRR